MTAPPDVDRQYRDALAGRRARLAALDRTHARFGVARLIIAGSAVALLLVGGWATLPWLGLPLALFAAVAIAHGRLLNRREEAVSAVAHYERGLQRLAHAWIGAGRTGERWHPDDHLYADDLDLFGRGSIFELIATTRTQAGEAALARWLLEAAPPDVIASRQEAVRELASRPDLREQVAVLGDRVRVGVDGALLARWAATPVSLRGRVVRAALAGLAAATTATLTAWIVTGRFGSVVLALVLVQMVAALWFRHRVLSVIAAVDEPSHDLDLLAALLRIVEREPFTSPHLRALAASVSASGHRASAEIARLAQYVGLLASRRNVLFAPLAALWLWATQWAFAVDHWRAHAGRHIPAWLDAVGEFEALLALGTFAAEHPDYVFPLVAPGPTALQATALAHPVLPRDAVPNDLALGGPAPRLIVVSGSNMSGKSTFLRAIGVNVVLAQMGAPVRATSFRMPPLAVGASIMVHDSLTDGRSRFFAEIVRLKRIVDLTRARQGAVLFLLDEILSGTNSHDRRAGAEALLAGLIGDGAVGLVTTHDLALGEVAEQWPDRAENRHFSDRFDQGTLVFDYTLRPGVVRTSNAIPLMRSIGLDV